MDINEVSARKLGRYISSSSRDVRVKEHGAGAGFGLGNPKNEPRERKIRNRQKGIDTAADKLSGSRWVNVPAKNEEVEMYTIEDLVASAVAQKPGDFEEVFNSIILDKIDAAVEERKLELAQTMFNEKCREEEEEGGHKKKSKKREEEEEEGE